MPNLKHELSEIIAEGVLAIVTLLIHVIIGSFVLALPAIAHPYTHWLYGGSDPILIGTVTFGDASYGPFSLPNVVHGFDYAVAFGVMLAGGWRAVVRFWGSGR